MDLVIRVRLPYIALIYPAEESLHANYLGSSPSSRESENSLRVRHLTLNQTKLVDSSLG